MLNPGVSAFLRITALALGFTAGLAGAEMAPNKGQEDQDRRPSAPRNLDARAYDPIPESQGQPVTILRDSSRSRKKSRWANDSLPRLRDSIVREAEKLQAPPVDSTPNPEYESGIWNIQNSNLGVRFMSLAGDRIFALTEYGMIFARKVGDTAWAFAGNSRTPLGRIGLQAVDSAFLLILSDSKSGIIEQDFDHVPKSPWASASLNIADLTTGAFISRETGLLGAKGLKLIRYSIGENANRFDSLSGNFMAYAANRDSFPTEPSWLASQAHPSDSAVVLAGSRGVFARYGFKTNDLRFQRIPQAPDLHAVSFQGSQFGVVAGDSGFVAATSDGGVTWTSRRLPGAGTLRHLAFDDITHGFMAGDNGGLYETRDAGRQWTRLTRDADAGRKSYMRFPPPAYYAFIVLALFLVMPAFRRGGTIVVERGIGDKLSPDQPLDDSSQDVLGLNLRAEALAGFMMNPSTKPPLTFGVIGEWGKGKSSLLQLTRNRLDRKGFVTVWFNAWHHQSEESLMASLLENIRRSGLLSFWTLDGFAFRMRLIRRRALGQRPIEIVLLFAGLLLFTVLAGVAKNYQAGIDMVLRGLLGLFGDGAQDQKWLDLAKQLLEGSPLLLSTAAAFQFLRRILVLFRVQPAQLLTELQSKTRISDLSDKIGFRESFRREFEDVTAALADKPLVVFIDDLDRCRPEKVMEVLETMNFLVTCGACYFVVAMDKVQVTRAIVSHDKEYLERFREEGLSYQAYAQQYLEKLINIELSVPTAEPGAFVSLLKGEAHKYRRPPEPPAWRNRVNRNLPFILIALLAFFGSAYALHVWLEDAAKATEAVAARQAEKTPPAKTGLPGPGPTGPDSGKVTAATVDASAPGNPEPPSAVADIWEKKPAVWKSGAETPPWTRLLAYTVLYLTLGYLLIAYLVWRERRARLAYADSKEFHDAVEAWGDLLQVSARTPRGAKKYLNRLRFFATLRRQWEEQLKYQQGHGSTAPAPAFPNDQELVALACFELALRRQDVKAEDQELSMENAGKLADLLETPEWNMPESARRLRELVKRKPAEWNGILDAFAMLGAQIKIR
jgi:hypothetical protein